MINYIIIYLVNYLAQCYNGAKGGGADARNRVADHCGGRGRRGAVCGRTRVRAFCPSLRRPSGDPPALRVTLTLYDQDGRPLCQSERSVSSQPQKDSWQGVIALPDGGKGSYSVAVQPEK